MKRRFVWAGPIWSGLVSVLALMCVATVPAPLRAQEIPRASLPFAEEDYIEPEEIDERAGWRRWKSDRQEYAIAWRSPFEFSSKAINMDVDYVARLSLIDSGARTEVIAEHHNWPPDKLYHEGAYAEMHKRIARREKGATFTGRKDVVFCGKKYIRLRFRHESNSQEYITIVLFKRGRDYVAGFEVVFPRGVEIDVQSGLPKAVIENVKVKFVR